MINQKSFKLGLCLVLLLLLLGRPAAGSARETTLVRINPAFQQVTVGEVLSLQVLVENVSDLYAYDVKISFPPQLLEVLSAQNGDFLTGFPMINQVDNTLGTVQVVLTQFSPALPKSGSGVLIELQLRARATQGLAQITIDFADLSDKDGYLITCDLQDGRVQVGSQFFTYLPVILK